MAALTGTKMLGAAGLPLGQYILQTEEFTIANANAADEWIDTGYSEVIAVVGVVVIGTAVEADLVAFVENASGTGDTEDSDMGYLGIEGAAGTYQVTYIARY
jgi:hypothetical protein